MPTNLILIRTLPSRHYFDLHFMDEADEAQGGSVICLRPHSQYMAEPASGILGS